VVRALAQVALDGMSAGRRNVLERLMGLGGTHATATIAGHCRLPETTTRRHLQDLNAHGVVDKVGDYPERWVVSDWTMERWWAVTGTQS